MASVLSKKELARRYAEKLKSSGLTLKHAKKLRFAAFSRGQAKALKVPEYAGFKIPYFDERGKPTTFYRVRYLEETRAGFAKHTDAKALRYAQAGDTVNEVYMPPLIDWEDYFKTKNPIVITEGELKAACATALGLPVIGLGGVWCFRAAKKGIGLLPIFDRMNLKGKAVYIIYDSDAVRNPQIAKAENTLCREILRLGGEPKIVRLPDVVKDGKTGLDDFLLARSVTDVLDLMEQAAPYKVSEELHRLNEEVVYVEDPGFLVRHDTGQKVSPRNFVDHAYATRIIRQEIDTGKGTKIVEASAPREWLKWPHRAAVKKLVYRPGRARLTGDGHLNTWRGWGCEPEENRKLVQPWTALLDFVFKGEPESRRWFEQWCAYPLQNPGKKMHTAAVVWGLAEGTGKTLIGYILMRLYGENAIEINDEALRSSDNDYAENRQFAVGDEITGGDKRGVADRLKSLITRQTVRINLKYVPRYTTDDCINYYFTSNHPDAFFLGDKDRRFFIHEVVGDPGPKTLYDCAVESYVENKRGDVTKEIEAGRAALFFHLLCLPMEGFSPSGHAPMTKSKMEMIDTSRSEVGAWVNRIKSDPDSVLRIDKVPLPFELWRAEDLMALYDPEKRTKLQPNGMARELAKAGFQKVAEGRGCKTAEGQVRLWALRNGDKWAHKGQTECGETYDRERKAAEKPKKFEKKGAAK